VKLLARRPATARRRDRSAQREQPGRPPAGAAGLAQRALVAGRLANMPPHRPTDKDANLHTSRATAAALLNVSERGVASAAKVLREATTRPTLAPDACSGPQTGATGQGRK